MYGNSQSGMQCVESEALLAEALDGTLHGSTLAAFEAHQQSCPACRAMMQEVRAGMQWLKRLEEVEPPRNLVHNILAATIGTLPSEQVAARFLWPGGYAALCNVVRHGLLFDYHAAECGGLPHHRLPAP
jgi:predicted anti-sigma-YlaC factor YlaD